jgi:hypothetical protein
MSRLSAAMRRLLRRLPGTGSPSLPLLVAQVFNLCVFPLRIALGAAHARRRTFAAAFQAFTHSMLPSLRHPGCARPATPAPGHGQPLATSRSTGFQPVCLPASPWDRLSFRKGEQQDRRHAQKPVRRVPRGGRSGAFEPRTHPSRRRRACRRPAAVALQRARITCDPYQTDAPGLVPAATFGGRRSWARSRAPRRMSDWGRSRSP